MRILLLLALVATLASGCGTGPARPDDEQLAAAEAARADMQAGNYATAAEQFKQLADESRGEQAAGYRIDAAEAFFKAGDPGQVRQQLERVELEAEEQPLLFVRERLLGAQLALADDNTELALERLQGAYPADTQPLLRGEYHLLRARAYETQGKTTATVAERLAADYELREQTERMEHLDTLWEDLRRLDRTELNELRKNANPVATGWLELALIEKAELTDPANLRRTLDDWQLQYPDHPGVETVLPGLRSLAENIGQLPKQDRPYPAFQLRL
ncbi:MAG: penicillin-binding protein activator [Gammaproteobacteria bacterium]|nr:penicillin-binding protein activator [Gammaproteobacteria bacterium]